MQPNPQNGELKARERLYAFGFGVVFVIAMLTIAVAFPRPSPFQWAIFKIVIALAAAGIAAMIPGFLEVTLSKYVRAGGAIAVFVIIYFFNPAVLVVEETPTDRSFLESIRIGARRDYIESKIGLPEHVLDGDRFIQTRYTFKQYLARLSYSKSTNTLAQYVVVSTDRNFTPKLPLHPCERLGDGPFAKCGTSEGAWEYIENGNNGSQYFEIGGAFGVTNFRSPMLGWVSEVGAEYGRPDAAPWWEDPRVAIKGRLGHYAMLELNEALEARNSPGPLTARQKLVIQVFRERTHPNAFGIRGNAGDGFDETSVDLSDNGLDFVFSLR